VSALLRRSGVGRVRRDGELDVRLVVVGLAADLGLELFGPGEDEDVDGAGGEHGDGGVPVAADDAGELVAAGVAVVEALGGVRVVGVGWDVDDRDGGHGWLSPPVGLWLAGPRRVNAVLRDGASSVTSMFRT
jgi:hypothetical protein